MDESKEWESEFVRNLQAIRDRKDRGALAALRQGLGREPGTVVAMFPIVEPRLRKDAGEWERQVSYLIASLFASHPSGGGRGNLGESLRSVKSAQHSDAMDARFAALLDSHPEDLPDHLRHAVSLCESKEVPVDWLQLLHDVLRWNDHGRSVQRRWAGSYWSASEEVGAGEGEEVGAENSEKADEEG